MARVNVPSIKELIEAYTASNQTPDTFKIGEGAVRGQELSDSILNNKMKREADELAIRKEIDDLKQKRTQRQREQDFAATMQKGPVVAQIGDQQVHAGETKALAPETEQMGKLTEAFPKEVGMDLLKQNLLEKSEAGKLERARLRQEVQNTAPDRIKQLGQVGDRVVGITYGGKIVPIDLDGKEFDPLNRTLPAEQVEKTGTFEAMTDLVARIREDVVDAKTGQLSEEGKSYLGPLDAPSQSIKAFTPAANVGASNFHQKLQDLKNQIIYLRSGKQINEQEYKRLRASLPSEFRDENIFLSNLDNFERTFKDVMEKRQQAFKQAGYKTPTVGGGAPQGGGQDIGAALRAILPKRK